jgi:predicted O-methyltransferase YrrM
VLLTRNDLIGKSTSTQVVDPERAVESFGQQIPNANRLMPGNVTQWVAAAYKAAVSGVLGGNLASALLIRRPRAVVEYWQNCLFVWRMVARQGLPQRQLHEILTVEESVDLNILPTTGHFVLWDASFAKDVLYLALICRVLQPRTVFEIGTLYGYTALLFALNSPPDATVYTLDLPADADFALRTTISDVTTRVAHHKAERLLFDGHSQEYKIRPLQGDSARFDFTPWKGSIDLFFIDGSHSYDYVRSDTERALHCCRPASVIVWHDYGRWGVNGVSKYLHELSRRYPQLCRLPGSSLAMLQL